MTLSTTRPSGAGQRTRSDQQVTEEPEADQETEAVEATLPLDVVFEIVKNERRRLILSYLRDAEDTVALGTLAEHIAAYENDVTVAELNAQQRKRVYIGLYQFHLPKMADANVVDFNQDRGVVRLGENADELFDFIESDVETRSNVHQYCLALSLGGGLLFAVATALGAVMLADIVVAALVVSVPLVAYVYRD